MPSVPIVYEHARRCQHLLLTHVPVAHLPTLHSRRASVTEADLQAAAPGRLTGAITPPSRQVAIGAGATHGTGPTHPEKTPRQRLQEQSAPPSPNHQHAPAAQPATRIVRTGQGDAARGTEDDSPSKNTKPERWRSIRSPTFGQFPGVARLCNHLAG